MMAISATTASGFVAFRIQCSDSKRKRGFGPKKDKTNKFGTSREENGMEVQQRRKSRTKQSGPSPTQAPMLSSGYNSKSNSSSFDGDFEERLAAVRRSAVEQKKAEESKEFGVIDYDAPIESEKKTIGLGTKIGVGVAVMVFGLVFALGDFLPSGSVSPTEEAGVVKNELSGEEKTALQTRLRQYEVMLSNSPKDPTALEGAAVTLAELGDYSRAASLLEDLGKEKPSDPDVFRLLGEVKYELKDYEGSAAAYRVASMVSKDINFEVLRGLTNALLAAKKPDEAVQFLLASRERLSTEKSDDLTVKDDSSTNTKETEPQNVDPIQGIILKENGSVGDAERMFIQVNTKMASNGVDRRVTKRLKTPKRVHFQGVLTSKSHTWALDQIRQKLTDAQKEIFQGTCFGYLLDMPYLKFSGQLIHNVLLREVHTYGLKGELWFLVSGVPIRFSCIEFGLIMGLRFGDEKKKKCRKVHRLRDMYFNGNTTIPYQQFDHTINNLDFTQIPDDDAVKLSLVFLAERFLYTDSRRSIDPWLLQYVDNLSKFNGYPWGNKAWETTYNCLRKALIGKAKKFQEEKAQNSKHVKEKYNVTGIPLAFQVWCYEAIPYIGSKYGNIVAEHTIPCILKWAIKKVPTHQAMARAFSQLNDPPLQRLQPTENEVAARFYHRLVAYWDSIVDYDNTDIHTEFFGGVHDEPGEPEESDATAGARAAASANADFEAEFFGGVHNEQGEPKESDSGVSARTDFEAKYFKEYIQNMRAYLQKQFEMLRMDISRIARCQDELRDEFEAQMAIVRTEARQCDEFIASEFAQLRQELRGWSGHHTASDFNLPPTDIPYSSLVYNDVGMTDVSTPDVPIDTGANDQSAYFDMVSANGEASFKISVKAPMGERMLLKKYKDDR